MFREMRRKQQALPYEESVKILESASSGVLAVLGDEGYPYTVPLSYVYHNGRLYFHSAMAGHKADAVRKHDKASFCVVIRDDVVPARFTTRYSSVIAFGRVREVVDPAEKRESILAFAKRYGMSHMERGKAEIEESWDHLMMIALDIEHVTGKESLELTQDRR